MWTQELYLHCPNKIQIWYVAALQIAENFSRHGICKGVFFQNNMNLIVLPVMRQKTIKPLNDSGV